MLLLLRHRWAIAAAVAVLLLLGALGRWQPDRQVRLHTQALLSALESKNWKRLEKLIADDYSDTWGQDKATLQSRVRQVFSQFLILNLQAREIDVQEADGRGTAKVPISLSGRGGPLAEFAMQRGSTLQQPFTFTWRQQSWKPWDWALIYVEQPELKLEGW